MERVLVQLHLESGPSNEYPRGNAWIECHGFYLTSLAETHAHIVLASDTAIRRAKCRVRPGVRYRLERTTVRGAFGYKYALRFRTPWARCLRLVLDADSIARNHLLRVVETWLVRPLAHLTIVAYLGCETGSVSRT